jgi:hypothetical protein
MVQKELLGLGVEEAGCHLTDTANHIEIQAAQDIGLIDQSLGCIGIIGKNLDIGGSRKPGKEIGSGVRHQHNGLLALALEIMAQSQR